MNHAVPSVVLSPDCTCFKHQVQILINWIENQPENLTQLHPHRKGRFDSCVLHSDKVQRDIDYALEYVATGVEQIEADVPKVGQLA